MCHPGLLPIMRSGVYDLPRNEEQKLFFCVYISPPWYVFVFCGCLAFLPFQQCILLGCVASFVFTMKAFVQIVWKMVLSQLPQAHINMFL